MSYKGERYKREVYKHLTRKERKPPKQWNMKTRLPDEVFKDHSVLEAIEEIKLNRKLSQKVSNVITANLFSTYSTEYQEHIKAIAEEIRKQKLY